MDCKRKNDLGLISIPHDVLASLAGFATLECYGVVAMASKKASDGLVELLGRENLSRGVKVTGQDDWIELQLFIVVEYGVSIITVARNIIDNVRYQMEKMTGLKVNDIKVTVQSVRV